MGIDPGPNGDGLTVSFRISDPVSAGKSESSSSAGGGQPTFPVVIHAPNITEAIESLSRMIPKTPVLNHLQGLFVSEDLAKDGISDVLEFVERDEETRRNVNIIIVHGQSVAQLFTGARPLLETSTGLAIRLSSIVTNAPEVQLGEFVALLQREGIDAIAPMAMLVPPVSPFPDIQPEDRTSTTPSELNLTGTALFHEDRLVGILDETEMSTFQILRNRVMHRAISFSDHDLRGAVRILNSRATIRMGLRGGLPEYDIRVNINARMTEIVSKESVNEPLIRRIEDVIASQVAQDIKNLIARMQSIGSDALGFGRLIHMYHPKIWHEIRDDWPGVYAKIEPNVSVNVSIQEVGSVTRSISVPRMVPHE